MVNAIKALKAELDKVNGVKNDGTSFTYNDSLAIFNALVAFAKARDKYLDYEFDEENDTKDSTLFVYGAGVKAGKKLKASTKFTELTFDALRDGEYDYTNGNDEYKAGAKNNGLANIADQLLGPDFGAALVASPNVNTASLTTASLTNAFFKTWKVDDYAKPTKITWADGTAYVPSAIAAAKKKVTDSIDAYLKAYNDFWNQNIKLGTEFNTYFSTVKAADKTKAIEAVENLLNTKKYNPECYTLKTFKDMSGFVEEELKDVPVLSFTGTQIDDTEIMLAILTAVDPNCTDRTNNDFFKGNITGKSAIFSYTGPKNATDFYWYMKAAYDYFKATNKTASQDVATIKKWIESVEKAFADNADRANQPDKNAYKAAKAAYDKAVAKAAAWDEYAKAKKAFVGTYVDEDGDEQFNTIFTINEANYNTVASVTPDNVFAPILTMDVFGFYDWNNRLGGEQLALAQELFPNLPEKMNAWKNEEGGLDDIADKLAHNKVMTTTLKDLYLAAAKLAENEPLRKDANKAGTWDALWNTYRTKLDNAITKQEGIINSNYSIIDNNQQKIKEFHEYDPTTASGAISANKLALQQNIIDLQAELKTMTLALEGVEKAYNLAKINYEKIMEYVQSVGAEYVIPVSAYDINSLLGSTINLLDNLGIDVGAIVNNLVGGGAGATTTTSGNTVTITF